MIEIIDGIVSGTATSGGGGQTINNEDMTITANGTYTASEGYTGIGTATVNVPACDEVVAINESGSSVSSGGKVWINKVGDNYNIVDFYTSTENFTPHGSPVISNGIFSLARNDALNYITYDSAAPSTVTSFEMVFKFRIPDKSVVTSVGSGYIFYFSTSNNNTPVLKFGEWYGLDGDTSYPYPEGLGIEVQDSQGSSTTAIGILSWNRIIEGQWYWIKESYQNGTISLSWSEDGINYVTTGMYQSTNPMYVNFRTDTLTIGGRTLNSNVDVDFKDTYLDINGSRFWTPVALTPNITQDFLTGVAQENIAVNASGTVKTILP